MKLTVISNTCFLAITGSSILLLSAVRTDQISCAMNFIILFQYKAAPELKTQ